MSFFGQKKVLFSCKKGFLFINNFVSFTETTVFLQKLS
ncbi:hypothetical protein BAOM_0349 [Peribacillus asahii]|uniref:Uncharacterized protein n=1 Tax=Peribacillus asahii TaxID=228899 RepID=A0A3T0KKX8_9BACI|nr:hypothetical protein BAOM_0349 [Peribacillus asahii]